MFPTIEERHHSNMNILSFIIGCLFANVIIGLLSFHSSIFVGLFFINLMVIYVGITVFETPLRQSSYFHAIEDEANDLISNDIHWNNYSQLPLFYKYNNVPNEFALQRVMEYVKLESNPLSNFPYSLDELYKLEQFFKEAKKLQKMGVTKDVIKEKTPKDLINILKGEKHSLYNNFSKIKSLNISKNCPTLVKELNRLIDNNINSSDLNLILNEMRILDNFSNQNPNANFDKFLEAKIHSLINNGDDKVLLTPNTILTTLKTIVSEIVDEYLNKEVEYKLLNINQQHDMNVSYLNSKDDQQITYISSLSESDDYDIKYNSNSDYYYEVVSIHSK